MLGNYERWKVSTNIYSLENVQVIKPGHAGGRWKGVSHYKLVNCLLDCLADEGLKLEDVRYYLARNDQDIVFSCAIHHPEIGTIGTRDKDGGGVTMYPSLAFSASNAGRRGLTFYAGASSPTTPNKFVASAWLGKRYTAKFSPAIQMQEAYDTFKTRVERSFAMMRLARGISLSETMVGKILLEAGQRALMPWSRIGKIAENMRQIGGTAYQLLLQFGKLVERNPPQKQLDQMYGFTRLVKEFYPEVLDILPEESVVE